MGYRDDVRSVKKEGMWFFWTALPAILVVLLVVSGISWIMKGTTKIGDTIVERKIFENSYQRSESLKSKIAVQEAQLAEIEYKLRNLSIMSPEDKRNLEAQASAIRIRINAARAQF